MKQFGTLFAASLAMLMMSSLVFAQDTTLTITGSGNVGIGTTVPGSKLQVSGSVGVGDLPRFSSHMFSSRVDSSDSGIEVAVFGANYRTSGFAVGVLGQSSAASGFGVYSNGNFQVENGNATVLGNVGIGTTSPSTRLTIQTGVNQHGLLHTDGTHDFITWLGSSEGTEGAWIGPTTPYALSLQTSNLARVTISSDGNVGIGTTTPQYPLHVVNPTVDVMQLESSSNVATRLWLKNATIANRYAVVATGTASGVGGGKFFVGQENGSVLTARLVVDSLGNVGIGTGSPDQVLSVNGNASKVGGGSWATFSDRRLKKDIKSFSDGLSVLQKIRPVTFRYNGKLGYPTDKTYVGVIAQEIRKAAPYTVDTYRAKLNPGDKEKTNILRYDSSALIYIAINAIKELDAKVDEIEKLQDENKVLAVRLSHLETLVNSLASGRKGNDDESLSELR